MLVKIQYTDQASRQMVLDVNKDKYLIEEDNITEGNFLTFTDVKPLETQVSDLQQLLKVTPPVANPLTLSDYQTNKIAQITDLYNQKLTAGFSSSASGSSHVYGYATSDQMKFMQVALKVLLSPTTAFPVIIHPKDGSSDSLNQAQYTQLIADIATFAETLDAQQHSYIVQVNACTTVDQVNAIVVTF